MGLTLVFAPSIRSRSGQALTISYHWIGRLVFTGLLLVNVGATAYLTYISKKNYPGGEAMSMLHLAGAGAGFKWVHSNPSEAKPGEFPPERRTYPSLIPTLLQ